MDVDSTTLSYISNANHQSMLSYLANITSSLTSLLDYLIFFSHFSLRLSLFLVSSISLLSLSFACTSSKMHFTSFLTLALSTLAAAKPYYGQYDWANTTLPSNYTGAPCKSSSTSGAAYPTGTGSPSKTTALPVFTGAAFKPQSEMLGLMLAIGGGVVMLA
ncbi:uncharacterized protein PV09_07196 [Verruconis gallopava]|uniref:Uncharacterized protein n=1 Tax=Verruconis gallopava TaxID=253628 RepID=A0A0D2A3N1_9PEZI|nr:uncharacterized protein PV09_07196 [Verruconis gallopava]KIW01438.1 hypothetical protein PV09_07196 [Verruconis gallopava]